MTKHIGAESAFKNERIEDDFYKCVIEKVEEKTNEASKSEDKRYLLVHVRADAGIGQGTKLVFPMPCTPTAENMHGKLVTTLYGGFEVGREYDDVDYVGKKILIFWEWNQNKERMQAKVFKKTDLKMSDY